MKADVTMRARSLFATAFATVLAAALTACASPALVTPETPPPPVNSVAEADQQLAAVTRERAAIEARFSQRETYCYTKFFVNNCLDEAKEQHRTALVAQRAIEVQANHFKREALVADRDRALAEAERRFNEQQTQLAAQAPKPAPVVTPAPPPRPRTVPQRTAERNARVKAQQQKDVAEAPMRAKNVSDYEARKADSEARVRQVAQHKAEKAAKAAKDAAAAKDQAAQAAAKTPPAAK
jgi:hypothetical protein